MEVKACAKTLRIPPRKARLVIDLIRGKDVEEAAAILKFTPNVAAEAVGKVLKSAVANAVNNNDMNEEKLYVKACYANEGNFETLHATCKRICKCDPQTHQPHHCCG